MEVSEEKDVLILAIESSCDETAASVVKNGREVLSNVISSQIALHTQFGGVVPEIASRKHIEKINQVIEQALADAGVTDLCIEGLEGQTPYEKAEEAVEAQIQAGWPIPCLTLKHKEPAYDDYVWHWYMLTGYKKEAGHFSVKAVTYGGARWLDFRGLWDTGYEKKGGLILYRVAGTKMA